MKNYFEELRPKNGETFQIHMQITDMNEKKFTQAHIHDFVEMLFCYEGEYIVTVDTQEFKFKKGTMIIIGSRKIHTVYPLNNPVGKYLVLKFQPEMIFASPGNIDEFKYILPFINKSQTMVCEDVICKSELKNIFDNIYYELNAREYGYEIALRANIYHIISWVLRNLYNNKSNIDAYTKKTLSRIENVLDYIEHNYKESLNVRILSEYAHMEYCYFSRIFKEITNMNCSEYINYIRIQKAQILLMTENLNISEVGECVGFDSTSYFIKQFKKINGSSPKKYIKEKKAL